MSVTVLIGVLVLGAAAQTPMPDAPDESAAPDGLVAPKAADPAVAPPVEPDDAEPDDAEPDDAEPDNAEPDDAEPDDGEPDDAEPDDGEPDDAEPDDAEPVESDDAAPVMMELAGAFSMTSAGPATFALSDVLHVNRILHLWPEFRVGARWPFGNFGVGGEVQVGHTSVAQGNSIVGERLYLLRGAAVGTVDYRIDLHRRSVLDGVRLGFTGRLDVQGGVRALVAVGERRFGPVGGASLAAGPRVVIEWPWVNFVFDTFLGWGTGGPVSGAGLGLAFDFSI